MASEPISTSIIIKHGTLAVAGGVVHALSAYRNGKTKGLFDILALSLISAFTGVIFALLALHLYSDTYLTYALAGTGGFVGVEGMAWITDYLKGKVKE